MSSHNGNDYNSLVSKVWSVAHVLCDQGAGHGGPIRPMSRLSRPGYRYSEVHT